jgi:hypothetical protein
VRAYLVAAGYEDFHTAVDQLQKDAVDTGVVRTLGQDVVQLIIAESFCELTAGAST